MKNRINLTTTVDPFTGKSTGTPLVVIQLTPYYRKVLLEFLGDRRKYEHIEMYGADFALSHVAMGTPGVGGAVLGVNEACCIMEAADDKILETYNVSERNLFKWLYESIADLNL